MTNKDSMTFACVCASNVNRSMEGHRILARNGYAVASYGTNEVIRMPGASNVPHQFDFGATYQEILAEMESKNDPYYEEQGLIKMLRDDADTKLKPERFASTFNPATLKYFDIIFTYQDTIMERVLDEFRENGNRTFQISHVVNIQTPDSREEALKSSGHTLRLAEMIANAKDLTENLESICEEYNLKYGNIISFHIVTY